MSNTITSHIVLPYSWENCLDVDACERIVHYNDSADTMNNYPQEWVEELLGITVNFEIVYCNELGQAHRVDGPTVERVDGSKEWFLNGKLHREDGPAVTHSDGHKEWWWKGMPLSEAIVNSLATTKIDAERLNEILTVKRYV